MPTASPYSVLGVAPTASDAEVERRYRELLRATHPDLLQEADARAVAEATEQTRRINDAMAQIRSDRAHGQGAGRSEACSGRPTDRARRPCSTDRGTCPLCGATFGDLASFEIHLVDRHRADRLYRRRTPRRSALGSLARALRLVPIWMLLATTTIVLVTAGVLWALLPMLGICAVLWAQTTPHFRGRRS